MFVYQVPIDWSNVPNIILFADAPCTTTLSLEKFNPYLAYVLATFSLQYPGTKLEIESKELVIENISSLPLTINLCLRYPFQFMIGNVGWQDQNLEMSVRIDTDKFENHPKTCN